MHFSKTYEEKKQQQQQQYNNDFKDSICRRIHFDSSDVRAVRSNEFSSIAFAKCEMLKIERQLTKMKNNNNKKEKK